MVSFGYYYQFLSSQSDHIKQLKVYFENVSNKKKFLEWFWNKKT